MISYLSYFLIGALGGSLLIDLALFVAKQEGEIIVQYIPVVIEDDVPLHRSRVVQSGDSVVEQE